jgi:hypothetical protein
MNPTSIRKRFANLGGYGAFRLGGAEIKSIYGFAKPYDFTRALPFLIAGILLFSIIVATGGSAFFGRLHWDTPRSAYFIYMGSLAVVAAAVSFAPRLAWIGNAGLGKNAPRGESAAAAGREPGSV